MMIVPEGLALVVVHKRVLLEYVKVVFKVGKAVIEAPSLHVVADRTKVIVLSI